jgi:Holliday junction resolvase RusA-like endonuclease
VDKRTHQIVKKTPGDMKAAQDAICWHYRAAARGAAALTGPLRLEVLAVYRIPPSWPLWKQEAARLGKVWKTTVPDHDNIVKQISDALNGHAYADDAQIVQSSFGKRYGQPERTEVRLIEVDGLCDHSAKAAFQDVTAAARGQDALPGLASNARNTLPERTGRG